MVLIHKLTIKIFSNQRFIDLSYYLKHSIAIMYRQCFRTISQNPECVEIFSNNIDNPFHLSFCEWILDNQ